MKTKLLLLFCVSAFYTAQAQIQVTEVYYDTPYSEESPRTARDPHHLGEYIELYNYSDEDILLDGWSLTDYVSQYYFPPGTLIPSNEFLLVAYRNHTNENYFTTFYPTTIGKETQILYQNQIVLRNDRERVQLRIGNYKGHEFNGAYVVSEMQWEFPLPHSNLPAEFFINPNTINYYLNSHQFNSSGGYNQITATPLDGYKPPTQRVENINVLNNIFDKEYTNLTWKYFSELLLNINCELVVSTIEQSPSGTYNNWEWCFNYDISGNNTSSGLCTSEDQGNNGNNNPNNPNNPIIEYTIEELEDINSKITLNPVPTFSNVFANWDATVQGKISQIVVMNSIGVLLFNSSILPNQSSAQFNLAGNPSGIYMVRFILNTGQIITRNIIKN
jgi:hypothetical protein